MQMGVCEGSVEKAWHEDCTGAAPCPACKAAHVTYEYSLSLTRLCPSSCVAVGKSCWMLMKNA